MVTIDEEVLSQAKEKGLNISQASEQGIKDKLEIKEVQDVENQECEFCGREMRKATADDLEGLTWLFPDEKWICPRCLRNENNGFP